MKKAAVPPTGGTVSDMGRSGAPDDVADTAVVAILAALRAAAWCFSDSCVWSVGCGCQSLALVATQQVIPAAFAV